MGRVKGHLRNGTWVRAHPRRGGAAVGGLGAVAGVALAVAVIGGGTSPKPASPEQTTPQAVAVRWVVDGDTLRVRLRNGGEQRVRLLAVDTPEVGRDGRAGDCYAREAAELTTQLVEAADQIVLVSDPTQPDQDDYDRLLRYVRLDGKDLGQQLLEAGAALVWVGDPPAQRVQAYRTAQARAGRSRTGLWAAC
ncbi:MAG: thermonuclease family protein [Nocardioides sp.]